MYIYFSSLSLRKGTMIDSLPVLLNETMSLYGIEFRNTEQRNYLQLKKRRIEEFIVDETLIKEVGSSELVWLCWISFHL